MKSLFILLIAVFTISSAYTQISCINYTNPNNITCIEVEGDFFWAGTEGGLYKWHKNGSLIAIYNVSNGLVNNNVRCIKKDYITGKLWVGTDGGVSVLDGTAWTSYTVGNGLSNRYVLSICIDVNGEVWVTQWYGISRYNGNTWTQYTNSTGLNSFEFSCIAVDNQNNKWIGSYDGLIKYDGTGFTYYSTADGMPGNEVRSIAIDQQGNKWIGTSQNGFCKYNGSSFTNYSTADGLVSNAVLAVAVDVFGNKWISTNAGVSKFDGTTWTTYNTSNGLSSDFVQTIVIDSQNNKWFGTAYGVTKYDGTYWMNYLSPPGLSNNDVFDAAIDSSNVKWFGTAYGLSSFNGSAFTNYTTADGLAGNHIKRIRIDTLNNLWIATSSGVSYYNRISFTNYTTADGLIDNNILSMEIDKLGNVWFGTYSGLSKFDGTSFTNYTTADGLPSNPYVFSIAADDSNNIWLGSSNSLIKFDGTTMTTYTSADGIICNLVTDIEIDDQNVIWIASYSGISRYDGTTATNYGIPEGLVSAAIKELEFDPNGILWVSTEEGLSKFNGTVFANYSTLNGIANDNIRSARFESPEITWLSTAAGVSRVTCQNPVVSFTADTVCLSQQTTFLNLSTKTDHLSLYQWDINNDGSTEFTSRDIIYVFPDVGNHDVKLTVSNGSCSTSFIKNVKVNSYPEITVIPAGSPSLCSGSSVTINAVLQNEQAGNTYSYHWSNGSSGTSITTGTTGTYGVTVANENCSSSSSNTVDVFVQTPFQNEQICLVTVDTVTWKNKIMWEKTPMVGTIGYNVYKEVATNYYQNIGFVSYTDSSFLIDYASMPESYGNRYKISLLDSCLNESQKSFYHNTMNLTIAAFGSTMGLSWTPYVDQSGNFTPSMYYIYKGSSPMTMALFDSIPGTQTSYNDNNVYSLYYYLVGVKKDIPCDLLGISESFSNKKDNYFLVSASGYDMTCGTISIYPNPMSSTATLSIPNFEILNPKSEKGSGSDFVLRISDLTGKVVRIEPLNELNNLQINPSSNLQIEIDRGNLKPGVYFVELKADRVYRGKLVVE